MATATATATAQMDAGGRATPAFAWLRWRALADDLLPAVQAAAATYLDSGLTPPDVPDALCCTHWLPIVEGSWSASGGPRACTPARHALECAVLAVAASAASMGVDALRGATVGGLEWWLQEQWPEDQPKELHTDKAVGVTDAELTTRHPILSSVTYLSRSGGPTAVFKGRTAALGFPSPSSLLLFEGDLPHCVLHTPPAPLGAQPTEAHPRRTLLVNFWATPPPGASDVPLPTLPPPPLTPPTTVIVGQTRGVESVLRIPMPQGTRFAEHATAWQQQLLPEHLASDDRLHAAKAAGGGGALPLVVVEYPPAPEEGLEQLVEALELH